MSFNMDEIEGGGPEKRRKKKKKVDSGDNDGQKPRLGRKDLMKMVGAGTALLEQQGWFVCESSLLGERILVAKSPAALNRARSTGKVPRSTVGYLPSCIETLNAVVASREEDDPVDVHEVARWLHAVKKAFSGGLLQDPPKIREKPMSARTQRALIQAQLAMKSKRSKVKGVKYRTCALCSYEAGDRHYPCRACGKAMFCKHLCGMVVMPPGMSVETAVCAPCQMALGLNETLECESCHGDVKRWEASGNKCQECAT